MALGIERLSNSIPNIALQSLLELTNKTISELRDSIWAMNKDTISLDELEQRINDLFWNYRKLNLPVHLELDSKKNSEELHFPSDIGMHLYRIIQEAIQNAIKHSNANKIIVSLNEQSNRVVVKITDNGSGFHWP